MTEYTAILTAPDGRRDTYTVTAANKTEARRKVAELYYEDVPRAAKACGFYSFSDQRLTWAREG